MLRPTSEKVREALFSILGARVTGGRFLDLYAGTGAVGIEALSRGAASVTFIESNPRVVRLLRKNLLACNLVGRADVRGKTAETFLGRPDHWGGSYDVVFADPPYALGGGLGPLRRALRQGLVAADGVMVLEQGARTEMPVFVGVAELIRQYIYGDTALLLFAPVSKEAERS
jgi:16S rRNA (guanine(966)-N(2))-methyltransferase RsmD